MASPCSGDPSPAGLPPCPVATPGETCGGGRDGGEVGARGSWALRMWERRQRPHLFLGGFPRVTQQGRAGWGRAPHLLTVLLSLVLQPLDPELGRGPGSSSLLQALPVHSPAPSPTSLKAQGESQVLRSTNSWTSLVDQWLRVCAPNAGGVRSIPGQGNRPHMPRGQQ